MSIDEAIAKYKEITNTDANCPAHCNISCDKCVQESEQLAEWLEELKAYREIGTVEGYKSAIECYNEEYTIRKSNKQYNKAIDDLVKFANTMPTVEEEDGTIRPMWLEEMAEQLKAGGENEQSI